MPLVRGRVRGGRRVFVRVFVEVQVRVRAPAVGVRVDVYVSAIAEREEEGACAEEDDHQRDAEFEGRGDAFGDCDFEQYDDDARGEQSRRVADAPHRADERGARDRALLADNRRDGDEVVGLGRVLQAEEESEAECEEGVVHTRIIRRNDCARTPPRGAHFKLGRGAATRR